MIVVSALGGLGIGSLLTTLLKENFEAKKLRFREKHLACSGYLEALQNCVVKSSEEHRQKVVFWHKRIELVAPDNICEMCQKMYSSNPSEVPAIRDELVKLMKKDINP